MDTWGISGPTFLTLYGTALAAFVAIALLLRIRAGRGGADRPPTPAEIAFLTGGPLRAVYASIAALRAAGVVDVDGSRRIVATGTAPSGLSTLDAAVYDAARRQASVSQLEYDQRVRPALEEIRAAAVRAGWVLDDDGRVRIRLGSWLVIGLAVLGIVRIVAGVLNDRPVGYLVMLTLVALVIGLVLRKVPQPTPAGRRAVARSRKAHQHLAPSQAPAWSTYGMTGAAMAVALYGATSLWAADPAFAAQAGIRRDLAAGYTGSSSGGGGCGGGGGDSGGGGGDGGGGGGCGGGGCGG